ncbi:regulator of chromosome condensation 1/beta-lactamase-inhibitor protein II [Cryomyces antarcticus]
MAPKKAAPGPATRTSSRQAAATTKATTSTTAAPPAPPPTRTANTGAKIIKKAPTKATNKAGTTTAAANAKAPAKRGRPKKDTTAATASAANGTKPKTTTKTKATTAPAKKPAAPRKKPTKVAPPAGEDADEDGEDGADQSVTKPKATRKRKATEDAAAKPAKKAKIPKKGPVINYAPTQRLHVYVFGEGSSGELGLGTAKTAIDVKRPRLNPYLAADTVGVVQIATGGMHVVALTHDNKILTWGVNDQGALGRDTEWEGGLKDIDDNKSDDDSDAGGDAGLNPKESTPTAIPSDSFPEGTNFVRVAAGDSTSFALTDDGKVWGWGTFRSNEGIFGFTKDSFIQKTPLHLEKLKKIKDITCGANHTLALDNSGAVFAWGSGQQNQLGRRVVERTKTEGLVPREFGLPKKIKFVACGSYHSFAVDSKDQVWAWGLNNYGETGIPESAGEDSAVVLVPEIVDGLEGKHMTSIKGGAHHSISVTAEGECLVWGRVDGFQMGIPLDSLVNDPATKGHVIFDQRQKPRILTHPTPVPVLAALAANNTAATNGANGTAPTPPVTVAYAAAASDHCIAITTAGTAYSWGFSANYQTGPGTDDDVETATLIDNTAVRGKKLNWAGAGGQYSILTALAEEAGGAEGEE